MVMEVKYLVAQSKMHICHHHIWLSLVQQKV